MNVKRSRNLSFCYALLIIITYFFPIFGGAISPSRYYPWNNIKRSASFPVSWEITFLDSSNGSIKSQTESYKEIWTLDLSLGIDCFFKSPRASRKIHCLGYLGEDRWFPSSVVISEEDLAILLGIPYRKPFDIDQPGQNNLIFIPLYPNFLKSNDFIISFSKKQHFSINLTVGR